MHLGVMMECEQRAGASQQDALDEAFALADAAEQGGLDAVWLAERHFASPQRVITSGGGAIPSFASAPLILATAIAARTSRLRVGIAVSILPLSHPIRLAEEVATLDHVSRGRLEFGVGRSGFTNAYEGYGIAYGESRDRFQECVEILRLAWTRDTFSYTGAHYTYTDVTVVPKPYQTPHPPMRVAATTQETFPQMGRAGEPIFVGLRGTDLPQVASNLAAYREAWQGAGHAGSGNVYLRIPVYVAETQERAYSEPQESAVRSYKRLASSFAKSVSAVGTAESENRAQRAESLSSASYDDLLASRLAFGTPDAVMQRLQQLRDELQLSGFVIEPNVGGSIPRDLVFSSMQMFATQVAPALR